MVSRHFFSHGPRVEESDWPFGCRHAIATMIQVKTALATQNEQLEYSLAARQARVAKQVLLSASLSSIESFVQYHGTGIFACSVTQSATLLRGGGLQLVMSRDSTS